MSRIKAVLFDLDGTLYDTSQGIFHTANYTVAALGYEPVYDEKQLSKFVGPPLKECFKIVYGFEDEALLSRCVDVYRVEYEKVGMHLLHLYENIDTVLETLRRKGIKTGVCTLKYEKLACMIFEEQKTISLFDTVHGTDDFCTITKAECIRRAMKDVDALPDETLMVGDTMNDLGGAKEAGCHFAAATWGFGFEKGTSQVEYGQVVDTPTAILDIVEKLNK